MGKPTIQLIQALRNTIKNLENSTDYQWGHMGSCNCGFLAQEITRKNKHQIHSAAMQRYGDWNEQLNDYCPQSGLLMDDLISQLLDAGLDVDDLKNLEKLSDKRILSLLPVSQRNLRHNNRTDVILYMKLWLSFLEEEYARTIDLTSVQKMEAELI
jgi:hypothetical protein